MSLRTLLSQAKVYIVSFYIVLVKQAMYKNYHTVHGITVLNLKVQDGDKNYSYSWNRML